MSDRLPEKGRRPRSHTETVLDKWASLRNRDGARASSWDWAGPDDLQAAIVAATEDGAALLFSKTSDGGALSIHVITEGPTIKLYPSTATEIAEALQRILEIAKPSK